MQGVMDTWVRAEAVEGQVFHLFISGVELEREVFVRMVRAEVRATRGELPFRKPELTDGHNASEFEAILPNVAVEVLAVVIATANTTARDDALRDEMKRTGTECAGGAGEERVLAKIGGHVVAILFPLIPIAGADNGGVLW